MGFLLTALPPPRCGRSRSVQTDCSDRSAAPGRGVCAVARAANSAARQQNNLPGMQENAGRGVSKVTTTDQEAQRPHLAGGVLAVLAGRRRHLESQQRDEHLCILGFLGFKNPILRKVPQGNIRRHRCPAGGFTQAPSAAAAAEQWLGRSHWPCNCIPQAARPITATARQRPRSKLSLTVCWR